MPIKDAEDSGMTGKALEASFEKCLVLAGMKFERNGRMGRNAMLWDFKPKGLGWKGLPDGALVNLKMPMSRTLFTSTAFWKSVFLHEKPGKDGDPATERRIRRALLKLGFHKIWWLKPKSVEIANEVMRIPSMRPVDKRVAAAKDILTEKNWSYYKSGRFSVKWDLVKNGRKTTIGNISLYKSGTKWVQIKVRVNKNAGNTAGMARTTSGSPSRPFKPVRSKGV